MSKSMRWRRRRSSPNGELEESISPEAVLRAAVESDARTDALCVQVLRTLENVIATELRDAALEDLMVVDVMPAPSSRRMRVVLRFAECGDNRDPIWVLERLSAARGFLRSQIAAEINRKRTPELVFELLPGPATRNPGPATRKDGR